MLSFIKQKFIIFRPFLALAAIAISSVGCYKSHSLTVFSSYVTRESRASWYIGSPDPFQNTPPIGQRIYASWELSPVYLSQQPLELKIDLRFKNREKKTETIALPWLRGTYTYSLLGNDFFDSGGVMTYKVGLYANGNLIEDWEHMMWVSLIEVGNCQAQNETVKNDAETSKLEPFEDFDFD